MLGVRQVVKGVLAGFCAFGAPPSARAEGVELSARLQCESVAGPGRIVCALTTNAAPGKLVWADALVVRAPPFARPLRSRIVAQLGSSAEPGRATAKLALVASAAGTAELELLVRGVVCDENANGERCTPEVARVSGAVEVKQSAPVTQ